MLVIATCKHSAYLELALKALETAGVLKHNLLVAPLHKGDARTYGGKIVAGKRDARTPVDIAFILAMILMLFGAIYGFVLPFGPIIWATIGLAVGGVAGYGVDYLRTMNSSSRNHTKAEVVLLIYCEEDQIELVEEVLWQNGALGVSKIGYTQPNTTLGASLYTNVGDPLH